jgi:AmmeMemoRadiSam system protein B
LANGTFADGPFPRNAAGLRLDVSILSYPRPFAGEHSLEMHLVMLQAILPAPVEIVPILVGTPIPIGSPRLCD